MDVERKEDEMDGYLLSTPFIGRWMDGWMDGRWLGVLVVGWRLAAGWKETTRKGDARNSRDAPIITIKYTQLHLYTLL